MEANALLVKTCYDFSKFFFPFPPFFFLNKKRVIPKCNSIYTLEVSVTLLHWIKQAAPDHKTLKRLKFGTSLSATKPATAAAWRRQSKKLRVGRNSKLHKRPWHFMPARRQQTKQTEGKKSPKSWTAAELHSVSTAAPENSFEMEAVLCKFCAACDVHINP